MTRDEVYKDIEEMFGFVPSFFIISRAVPEKRIYMPLIDKC